MYHGAEHKTINCIERGYDLTVSNVRKQSRKHKRCGTSFILFVAFVSIIVFLFIRVDQIWLRVILRVLLIPVVAGISYELIRYAGSHDNAFVTIISAPGMLMQRLTTKEPDDGMIEVAIASVDAVFDWQGYLDGIKQKGSKRKHSNKKGKKQGKPEEKVKNDTEDIEAEVIAAKVDTESETEINKSNQATKKSESKKQGASNTNKVSKNKSNGNSQAVKNEIKEEEVTHTMASNQDSQVDMSAQNEIFTAKDTSIEELTNLDKLLYERSEVAVEEKQSKLKERARIPEQAVLSSTEIAASLEPTEEEEDEILRALDKYFSSGKDA